MTRRHPNLERVTPPLYSLALTAAILGPLLGPGYLLLRDAVSTPRSYVTDSALGLTDAAARAVPQDWLIAVLSTVVDGGIVVKTILFAALWLAGWGAARMSAAVLPGIGLGPQLVASTVMLWNPYVAERLLQGHWSLLTGYAALPWIVCATLAIRRGRPGGWWALALCFAAAALTPTGALLAAALLVRLFGSWDYQKGARAACCLLLASAPWVAVTVMSGSGATSDPAGVAAFAARAEPGLGTIGSLAGLGGIWNAAAVPGSRTSWWAFTGTVLLLAVVACGLPALWRRRRHPVIATLAVLGGLAVLVPALGATGWGLDVGAWAVQHVPGAGLLRDTQKWVALAAPLYALAAAAGARTLASRTLASRTYGPVAVPVAAIGAVLLALPDLVWGVGGALTPVRYPPAWQQVAGILTETSNPGDIAVLPAGMFRKFPYSGDAPVLDPAPRMLPVDVLQTGQLVVGHASAVAGEGARAARVEQLLLAGAAPAALADEHVGWVLVERTTPGPLGESQRTLDELDMLWDDGELALYRVPGATAAPAPERWPALAAHLVWAGLLVVSAAGLGWSRARRRH